VPGRGVVYVAPSLILHYAGGPTQAAAHAAWAERRAMTLEQAIA
jgi:hypothetical protein